MKRSPIWWSTALLSVSKETSQLSINDYSLLYFVAAVAWIYSSVGVLFLSDSVPKLYNMFMTVCDLHGYYDFRDISNVL